MKLAYHLEEDSVSGGFIAYCPSMRPVSVFAKTEGEIESKIKDAVELYLQRHPELKNELYTIDI